MRDVMIWVLCICWACIITAAEKCGVDWGD